MTFLIYLVPFAILLIAILVICLVLAYKPAGKKSAKGSASSKTPRYKSLAEFAAVVEEDPTAIDSNIHAVLKDLVDELENVGEETDVKLCREVISEPLASLKRIAKARIADKSKPLVRSISELADLIEDRRAKIDPAIRSVLSDIYDYCEICKNEEASEDSEIFTIAYDLERAIYPRGITESQSIAASKRQGEKEMAVKCKMLAAQKSPQ